MTSTEPSISKALQDSPKNWGRWGPDDEIGALNFLTAGEAIRGAKAVRSGRSFGLGLEILRPGGDPVPAIRQPARKFMTADKGFFENGLLEPMPGGEEWSDDFITMYLQGSTQIDALGHIWFDDEMYNGYPASSSMGTLTKCSVKPMADHGIAGRGVLIDAPRHRGKEHLDSEEQISLADIHEIATAQGVELQKHDILLFRTGWINVIYENLDRMGELGGEPGITDEPELVRWFQEMEIPTYGHDNIGGELSFSPYSGCVLPLHGAHMRNLGIPIMELLWLEDLADDCAEDGQYTFMFVVSPLKIHGGTGSPINPMAIK